MKTQSSLIRKASLELHARGWKPEDIAIAMGVHYTTVYTHIREARRAANEVTEAAEKYKKALEEAS